MGLKKSLLLLAFITPIPFTCLEQFSKYNILIFPPISRSSHILNAQLFLFTKEIWASDLPPLWGAASVYMLESEGKHVFALCASLLSHVRLFMTLMDCSLPGSSPLGTFQARILKWVVISSSRLSPDPGIEPVCPALQGDSLPTGPLGKSKTCISRAKMRREDPPELRKYTSKTDLEI